MPRFPETNEAPNETPPETRSSNRPPQLNQTVCGCPYGCGCGCGCNGESEGDGGNRDDDGASIQSLDTLVASNDSVADDYQIDYNQPEQHAVPETLEPGRLFLPENENVRDILRGLLRGIQGIQLSEHIMGMADPVGYTYQGVYGQDYDDRAESMRNHPHGSDDHSVMSSDCRSVRCTSPGPGIGAWTEEVEMELTDKAYLFSGTPLRLTPQRRFCRGLVASHLVLHDV